MYEQNDRNDQADAWEAVCDTLSAVSPGWAGRPGTGIECATKTIRDLAVKARAYDLMVKFLENK